MILRNVCRSVKVGHAMILKCEDATASVLVTSIDSRLGLVTLSLGLRTMTLDERESAYFQAGPERCEILLKCIEGTIARIVIKAPDSVLVYPSGHRADPAHPPLRYRVRSPRVRPGKTA